MPTIPKPVTVKKSPAVEAKIIKIGVPTQVSTAKYMGDPAPPPATKNKKGKVVPVQNGQVVSSKALDRETVFGALYQQEGMSGALRPPYDPDRLCELIEENNTLEPCIDAMVTNVDGTGFEIIAADPETPVPDDIEQKLTKFFTSPWPNTTFLQMRKRLRRDLKTTGNAYIEVIRNGDGDIALIRRMDPNITRIMRLGNDTYTEEVFSATLGEKVQVAVSRRRYVQYVFGQLVYFKEFGAPLDLDRTTGKWEDDTSGGFNPEKTATEVIHLVDKPHHILPYGVPCWVAQLPSIIGSRKAEEFNLGFFDQGGVPPMMIVIQGGQAADGVEQAIKNLFYSAGPNKTTAAILQVQSTSGEIDDPGQVKVTVERFGQDRQKDQMFANYDANCEVKVRRAFRLPEMFVGSIKELNFASALASYRVAEAQVFKPERDQFDEIINNTLINAIVGEDLAGTILFRSMPITAKDMDQQLKALTLAVQAQAITAEELIDNLNEVTGLAMEAASPEERAMVQTQTPGDPEEGQMRNQQQLQMQQQQQDMQNAGQKDMAEHQAGLEAQQGTGFDVEGYFPSTNEAGTFDEMIGKRDVRKSEVRFPHLPSRMRKKKREITKDDIANELAGDVAVGLKKGSSREMFDSVGFLNANPGHRHAFNKKVAKRLFCCAPDEEESASRLAETMLRSLAA